MLGYCVLLEVVGGGGGTPSPVGEHGGVLGAPCGWWVPLLIPPSHRYLLVEGISSGCQLLLS